MWRRYRCLTSFFPIVDTCLTCEDIARQSCGMVPRWRLFGDFLPAVFSASRAQYVSDLHYKITLRPHHMCRSIVDIQYATAEIRRGKKIEETTGWKYIWPVLLHRAAINYEKFKVILMFIGLVIKLMTRPIKSQSSGTYEVNDLKQQFVGLI